MAEERKSVSHPKMREGWSLPLREEWNIKELGIEIIEDIALAALISLLCFNSPIALISVVPLAILNHMRLKQDRKEKFDMEFRKQYRELLMDLSAGLSGGTSIEGAFRNAEKELRSVFGEDCLLLEELHRLNGNVSLSMPVENAMMEFSKTFPYEEVTDFAELFSFAKRLGGNYGANIRKTASSIGESLELRQEIDAITAEKRMELHIMCVMPLGILAYLRIGSPDFIEPLYGNVAGITVVLVALAIYGGSIFLGRKILRYS